MQGVRSGTRNPAQFLPGLPGQGWGHEGPANLNNVRLFTLAIYHPYSPFKHWAGLIDW